MFDGDADLPVSSDSAELTSVDDAVDVQGHRRHRKKRAIDGDKLPQIRHEHDLPEEEKICLCFGHEQPYSVYDFTTSRTRDGPARFLQGFAGYLHADAFTGYDAIFLGSHVATCVMAL